MAFTARSSRGAALAAARPKPKGPAVGPVYRNTVKGSPRYGLFYRTVDVNGQRVHVYNNGQRIAVGHSRTPAATPSTPPVVRGTSRTRVRMTGPGRGIVRGTAS